MADELGLSDEYTGEENTAPEESYGVPVAAPATQPIQPTGPITYDAYVAARKGDDPVQVYNDFVDKVIPNQLRSEGQTWAYIRGLQKNIRQSIPAPQPAPKESLLDIPGNALSAVTGGIADVRTQGKIATALETGNTNMLLEAVREQQQRKPGLPEQQFSKALGDEQGVGFLKNLPGAVWENKQGAFDALLRTVVGFAPFVAGGAIGGLAGPFGAAGGMAAVGGQLALGQRAAQAVVQAAQKAGVDINDETAFYNWGKNGGLEGIFGPAIKGALTEAVVMAITGKVAGMFGVRAETLLGKMAPSEAATSEALAGLRAGVRNAQLGELATNVGGFTAASVAGDIAAGDTPSAREAIVSALTLLPTSLLHLKSKTGEAKRLEQGERTPVKPEEVKPEAPVEKEMTDAEMEAQLREEAKQPVQYPVEDALASVNVARDLVKEVQNEKAIEQVKAELEARQAESGVPLTERATAEQPTESAIPTTEATGVSPITREAITGERGGPATDATLLEGAVSRDTAQPVDQSRPVLDQEGIDKGVAVEPGRGEQAGVAGPGGKPVAPRPIISGGDATGEGRVGGAGEVTLKPDLANPLKIARDVEREQGRKPSLLTVRQGESPEEFAYRKQLHATEEAMGRSNQEEAKLALEEIEQAAKENRLTPEAEKFVRKANELARRKGDPDDILELLDSALDALKPRIGAANEDFDLKTAREPTVAMTPKVAQVVRTQPVRNVIEHLARESPSSVTRLFMKAIRGFDFSGTRIEVVDDLHNDNGEKVRGNIRLYTDGTQHIRIDSKSGSDRTLAHELVHAATVIAYRRPRTLAQRAARSEVDTIFKQAEPHLHPDDLAKKDAEEFLAEAYANPHLQEQLRDINYQGRNLWERLKQAIHRLLGVPETLMSRLEKLAPKIVEEPRMEKTKQAGLSVTANQEEPERLKIPRISAAQRLKTLLNARKEGKLTDEEFISKAHDLAEQLNEVVETKKYNRVRDRQRGPDLIRERLIRAHRQGDIDSETMDFALWALEKNPAIAHELGISIRKASGGSISSGQYNPAARIMTLFKGVDNSGTAVHEILHHTERMMPDDVRRGITDAWFRAYDTAYKNGVLKEKLALENMLDAMAGNAKAREAVHKAFQDGTLDYDKHYQLVNPSEFWAVNATRILNSRYSRDSWIGKAKQWLIEMVEKVKGILKLQSDSPVLKGIKEVLNTEGELKGRMFSEGMLQDVNKERKLPHDAIVGKDEDSLRRSIAYRQDDGTYNYYKTDVNHEMGDPLSIEKGLTHAQVTQKMEAEGHTPEFTIGPSVPPTNTTRSGLHGWKDGKRQFAAIAMKDENGKRTEEWRVTTGPDLADTSKDANGHYNSPRTTTQVDSFRDVTRMYGEGGYSPTQKVDEAKRKEAEKAAKGERPESTYQPPGKLAQAINRSSGVTYVGEQQAYQAAQRGEPLPLSHRPDLMERRKNALIENQFHKLVRERIEPLKVTGRRIAKNFKKSGKQIEDDLVDLAYVSRTTRKLASPLYDATPEAKKLVEEQRKEAQDRLDQLHPEYRKALEAYARELKKFSNDMYDYRVKAELIPKELAEEIKNSSEFYVPIRLDTRSTVGKRAKGLANVSVDPIARMVNDWHRTIRDNFENQVKQATYRLAEDENIKLPDGSKLFDVAPVVKYDFDPITGMLRETVDPLVNKGDAIIVMFDGKPYRMSINEKHLLAGLKNVPASEKPELLQKTMRGFSMFNAVYGGLKTAASPVFALKNLRDVQTAFAMADPRVDRMEIGKGIFSPKTWQQGIAEAGAAFFGKDVMTEAKEQGGLISRRGRFGLETEQEDPHIRLTPNPFQLANEFRRNMLGFEHGRISNLMTFFTKLSENIPRMAVYSAAMKSPKMWQSVGRANGTTGKAVEIALHKAVNKQQLSMLERELVDHMQAEAATASKNATVNFEPKGYASGPLNALFIFANAKTQSARTLAENLGLTKIRGGNTVMERLKRGNPYTQTGAGAYFLGGLLFAMYGYKNDPDNYSRLSDYAKDEYAVYKSGGLSVPLSQDLAIAWTLAQSLVDAKMNPRWADPSVRQTKAATRFVTQFIQNFWPGGTSMSDPVGGQQGTTTQYLGRLVTPTTMQIAHDLSSNQNPFGSPIVTGLEQAQRKNLPIYEVNKEKVSPLARGATQFMHKAGVMDAAPQSAQYLIDQFIKQNVDFVHSVAPTWGFFNDIFGAPKKGPEGEDRPNSFERTFFQQASPMSYKNDLKELIDLESSKLHDAGLKTSPRFNTLKQGEKQVAQIFKGFEKLTPEQQGQRVLRATEVQKNTLKKYNESFQQP